MKGKKRSGMTKSKAGMRDAKMKYIKLPKLKTISRKRSDRGTFSLPLELNSLPKKLFDELVDYIAEGIQQKIDKEQVRDRLLGDKVERQFIQSIGINNVTFTFNTIKLGK